VRFERRLAHPVDAVWRAVTEPDELAHWFPAAVTVELRAGGAMSFTFPDDPSSSSSGEVTELDPPHRFAFTWGGALLRFELSPEAGGSGCRLVLTYVLEDSDAAPRDAAGWHVCLDPLERRLDGAPAEAPGTGASDEWRAPYEDYAQRGLPTGAAVPD
jgi:uncharacterized protein YndB with AHSA1/START domain